MTATAVASDRVVDPVRCGTTNCSTRSDRSSRGMRCQRRHATTRSASMCAVTKEVVAAGLLGVMALAWYVALRPPAAPITAPVTPRSRPVAAGEAAPVVRLERLERLTPPPPALPPRDPFRRVVASSRQAAASGRPDVARARHLPPDVVRMPRPSGPGLDLIGVADSARDGAEQRVAILSGAGGLHHVRVGDRVANGCRVARIEATAVTLEGEGDGQVVRLTLRP